MRGVLRLVALVIYVGAGYLIGSMVGRLLLIPIAAVAHVSHTLQTGLSVATGLLGIFSAVGWWRARFGDFQVGSGVHGSARFAGAEEVRRSLGSGAGLVQIFNVADVETASWVSKSIGATTMSYQTTGTSTSRGAMQFFETKSSSTSTHALAARTDDAGRDHATGFQLGDPFAPGRRARHRRQGQVLRRAGVSGAVYRGERLNGAKPV